MTLTQSTDRRAALRRLLFLLKDVLDSNRIPFWLDSGTLLGIVRDGDFIAWEKDLDLGSWAGTIPKVLRTAVAADLVSCGCSVGVFDHSMNVRVDGVVGDLKFYCQQGEWAVEPKFLSANPLGRLLNFSSNALMAPTHVLVDATAPPLNQHAQRVVLAASRWTPALVRTLFSAGLKSIYRAAGATDFTERVPAIYFRQFSELVFAGQTFRIPAATSQYLDYRYGTDWRTPKQDWVTERDDGGVTHFRDRKSAPLAGS